MLEFLMKEKRDVFALLYEEGDGRAKKILQRTEKRMTKGDGGKQKGGKSKKGRGK